jgi:hypothetical protein
MTIRKEKLKDSARKIFTHAEGRSEILLGRAHAPSTPHQIEWHRTIGANLKLPPTRVPRDYSLNADRLWTKTFLTARHHLVCKSKGLRGMAPKFISIR